MAKWGKVGSRGNIQDRRGVGGLAGGGIITIIAAAILTYALGGNPLEVLLSPQSQEAVIQTLNQEDTSQYEGEDAYEVFASTVLGSLDVYWNETYTELTNQPYEEPTLVLFRNSTQSGCGGAYSQIGPHYCPLDDTIYLDERFFTDLKQKFGGSSDDVAQAYVIGHEVGHHVHHQLGTLSSNRTQVESIEAELFSDCAAGLWLGWVSEQDVLEEGEIREALDAAAAVGDDNIQRRSTGTVQPESWTHGSSEQRLEAFNLGYKDGSFTQCLEANNIAYR